MTKACQAFMTQEKFGRIVNLSSSSAQGNRGQANYSAAKAGLQGFTKTLAIELGRFGVTVACQARTVAGLKSFRGRSPSPGRMNRSSKLRYRACVRGFKVRDPSHASAKVSRVAGPLD